MAKCLVISVLLALLSQTECLTNTRIHISAWIITSREPKHHHQQTTSHSESIIHMIDPSPQRGAKKIFLGDSCVTDQSDELATCRLLDECKPLQEKIKKAGYPMPLHMRHKLQRLSCGFQLDKPLVCCASSVDDVSSRGKPEQLVPNSAGDIRKHRNYHLLPTDCGSVYENDRILSGQRTALFEMPWMVLIAYDSARGVLLSCGATLVSEWYVLTAAHCVTALGTKMKLRGVVLGEHDLSQDPDCEWNGNNTSCAPSVQNVDIGEVVAHTGYSRLKLHNDIALIRLAKRANISLESIAPVCLPITPELQNQDLVGHAGIVAGWGDTEDSMQSPVLLSAELPIMSNKDCAEAYNNPSVSIVDGQICAGGVPGVASCRGDSGGPLMYYGAVADGKDGNRMVQRGIVSYGSKRCGIEKFPGVYTRVGYYMEWILDQMKE